MSHLLILWGSLYAAQPQMRELLDTRIRAHFNRLEWFLAPEGVEVARPRQIGFHTERGNANPASSHATVDFFRGDKTHITTHHVYRTDEGYEGYKRKYKKKSKNRRQ
ncbi:hypothetical protein EDB85DRAFT_2155000 [Lactarius pseudohatsudake]|nr:hypothetical protein EDB85DRAFT_2155000 [Lactarius pseudohatsudake]